MIPNIMVLQSKNMTKEDSGLMARVTKRTLQAKETKKLIYEHATRLIREKGFNNVLVEDITTAAGVSVGAFYYYFKSKEDIVLMWADDLDDHYVEYYEREMEKKPRKNSLEILEGIINLSMKMYCELGRDFATISYSYIMRNTEANERYSSYFRVYRQIVRGLINEGQAVNHIRNDIPLENLVQNFYKATRGGIMDWCCSGGDEDIVEYTHYFLRCFIDGLRPPQ